MLTSLSVSLSIMYHQRDLALVLGILFVLWRLVPVSHSYSAFRCLFGWISLDSFQSDPTVWPIQWDQYNYTVYFNWSMSQLLITCGIMYFLCASEICVRTVTPFWEGDTLVPFLDLCQPIVVCFISKVLVRVEYSQISVLFLWRSSEICASQPVPS